MSQRQKVEANFDKHYLIPSKKVDIEAVGFDSG